MSNNPDMTSMIEEYLELLRAVDGKFEESYLGYLSWQPKEPILDSAARRKIVAYLEGLSEKAPAEAWVWFQLAWNRVAYNEFQDTAGAQEALIKTLTLDPDRRSAHVLQAWLLYRDGDLSRVGPAAQHLSIVLSEQAPWNDLRGSVHLHSAPSSPLSDFISLRARSRLKEMLADLLNVVPDGHSAEYCMTVAGALPYSGDKERWLNQAVMANDGDDGLLFDAHIALASDNEDYHVTDSHLQHMRAALKHLLALPAAGGDRESRERDFYCALRIPRMEVLLPPPTHDPLGVLDEEAWQEWHRDLDVGLSAEDYDDYYEDNIDEEFEHWEIEKSLPHDPSPVDLFAEIATDCLTKLAPPPDASPFRRVLSGLASVAGQVEMRRGNLEGASRYLLTARKYEGDLNKRDTEDIEWRVGTATALMRFHLLRGNYKDALIENQRAFGLNPKDTELQAVGVAIVAANQAVDSARAFDRILDQLAGIGAVTKDIRLSQRRIVQELRLLGALNDQVNSLRSELAEHHPSIDDEQIDRLADSLHKLMQESPYVTPSAWRKVSDNVQKRPEFAGLVTSAQHFLITAEVYFEAGKQLGDSVDAGLIAVEYSKVVEVQLSERFLAPLERYLDHYKRGFRLLPDYIYERKPDDAMWNKVLTGPLRVNDHGISLGTVGEMLGYVKPNRSNEVVLSFLQSRRLDADWAQAVSAGVKKITKEYRNGAAHKERLSHDQLEEFHKLLFDDGLLRRLASLPVSPEAKGKP